MPIYVYKCPTCTKQFDYFAKTFSEAPDKCPNCGAKNPKKQFSSFTSNKTDESSYCSTGTCSLAK